MLSWPVVSLEDLADIQIGKTPSRSESLYWGGTHEWVSISDMNGSKVLPTTREFITQQAIERCGMKMNLPGTVLLSFKLSIGKVAIVNRPLFTNEAIAGLSIKNLKRIIPQYLAWALRSIALTEGLDRAAKGLTLNKPKLQNLRIPLPPLNEQRRIAAILDQADELRRTRQEAVDALDRLRESLFRDSFVNVGQNSWPTVEIGDLSDNIRTGPFGSQLLHSEFVESGIAVLGIDNAVRNEFAWGERRYISEDKYKSLKRYTVKPDDLIITIMGTCGRCAVVPRDIPPAINTKHLCCITPDPRVVLPTFLHATLLTHPDIRRQLGVEAKGAVMPGLNMGIIKALKFRLPPIDMQKAFAAKVTKLNLLVATQREHMVELKNLFVSLQYRAFGEHD